MANFRRLDVLCILCIKGFFEIFGFFILIICLLGGKIGFKEIVIVENFVYNVLYLFFNFFKFVRYVFWQLENIFWEDVFISYY